MVCGFKVNVVTDVEWCLENGRLYAFRWCRGTRRGYFNASVILQIQCLHLAFWCDGIVICRNVFIDITFYPRMILTSFSNIFMYIVRTCTLNHIIYYYIDTQYVFFVLTVWVSLFPSDILLVY